MIIIDTSALIKFYLPEPGLDQLTEAVGASGFAVSRLAILEAIVTFRKSLFAKYIEEAQYAALVDAIRSDTERVFEVLALTDNIVSGTQAAISSSLALPLRAADALHIQTAVHFEAELFITADKQQARAAEGLGLKTLLIDAG